MIPEALKLQSTPQLRDGRLVLGLTGWMDGGNVSSGTVEWLAQHLGAERVGEIDPEGFYIYNFPGSMEISALFRPTTHIEEGCVISYEPPTPEFYADATNNVLLLAAKEPHLHWVRFAECIFAAASALGVRSIYFVGSVGGAVPHSREPRLFATVSDPGMKPPLEQLGVKFTDYEGPASFTTYLFSQLAQHGMQMTNLVAEIPAYIQGANPKCIETMIRALTALLGLRVDLESLRSVTDTWERRVGEVLEDEEELSQHIEKLEEDYDNEVFDTQMGELKAWLQQRGLRVD